MLTPRFSCSQNDRSVVVSVYCPAVRASEIEIHVSDALLTTSLLLSYDPASGYLMLTLTKQNPGENFPDLDLLGKLLAPPPQNAHRGPAIEVLGSQDSPNEYLEAAANDWSVRQTIPDTLPTLETSLHKPYGFLNAYTGYFLHVATTENEVNELGADAEILSPLDRRARRLQHEDSKWDPEHYMADFADSEQIEELLAWTHPYLASSSSVGDVVFTDGENATMLRLPRREYIASPQETRALYLTLVTLLFSYAYDARTTQHDPTPESAWTISALTPAFSALDPPPYPSGDIDVRELAQSLTPSYRRALAFPLYRHAARTPDVLLACGTRTVLRCLLELRAILDAHEVYYVYSRIWLDDFCRWIQACASEDSLKRLGQDVGRLNMSKNSLGWDLVALERAVLAAREGQSDSDDEEPESDKPAI
ncbi:SHQ1-domain-containing protein [Lactarius akahatsu]|uniref:SHQ1-domain-containing protein n=1 Tax=Lactarius akahatsu TaxID=416441 RepID=A0AAD4LTP3_9AGAM|nr:SHQ1-domain-containing protein [Lactarius akahatsu]